MGQEIVTAAADSLAAQAFNDLSEEIRVTRREVERIADERTTQPDYGPSIEELGKRLEDLRALVARMEQHPALKLDPQRLADHINNAAMKVRAQDREELGQAIARMDAAGSRIDAITRRARSAADQDRELNHNRVAFAIAGMMLWSILPGAVARSLPVSWAVPERIAARMLGTDMWQAGQTMMLRANPDAWRAVVKREQKRNGRPAAPAPKKEPR
jgi:hypothetical protein